MRRLILLGLMSAMVLPAPAAKRLTVEQLEQAVAAELAARRADADVARAVGEMELTERLTDATLERFAARLALGPRTALALQLLSDQSAFFDPPSSELPATAAPAAAEQERMMDAARGYVADSVPRLPNFFATRATNRFDDTPQAPKQGDWPVRAGLHLVGSSSRNITFRDGKEILDPQTVAAGSTASPKIEQEVGLHTWGEFGPELAVVLTDTAKGTVAFSHWEKTQAGLAAVYRYAVPRAASHYSVNYCCLKEQDIVRAGQTPGDARSRSARQMMNVPAELTSRAFTETPGYHGSLAIDPATGAILRITLEAELSKGDPLLRAATVVEYGPVAIGERRFTCPVRSLAISMEQAGLGGAGNSRSVAVNGVGDDAAWQTSLSRPGKAPVLLINETSFTHYRRLGSTLRVVADGGPAVPPPGPPQQGSPGGQAPVEPATGSTASDSSTQPSSGQSAEISRTAAPAPAEPVTPSPPPEPVIPEVSLDAARGVPDQPANPTRSQTGEFQLKMTSRLVDVGILAYDKKGHPVKDLKAEDFEVYDNGRRQEVRFFTQFASGTAANSAPATAAPAERSFSNRVEDRPAAIGAGASSEAGATVLLIDEGHIAWGDLTHARQEILRFVGTLAPGERVGLYTITRTGFRVLKEITTDHAALTAVLAKWMPSAQSISQAQDEEVRNRQQFNEVHSVADLNSVNGNQIDVPDAESTLDPMLRSMGSNPARASLQLLIGVARHLSAVPGHKSLVWVSTDNVFADWENQAVGIDKSPKMIESFAAHVQEAMNDAHVAVYPMDVSQLESAAITADIQHRNVELTQAAADVAGLNGGAVARNMAPGRITAQMQQDIHPIQGPIREVAEATGGRVIRRAGDLAAQLAGVVDDGRATYLVSFAPQGPADGQYHAILVKTAGRHGGLALHYRTGYLFEKEPATLRERFQQAIWRPIDASEISVSARAAAMTAGVTVKIDIATADLALEEQAGRWMDKLDIFFIQRDDAGLHAQLDGQTLGLRLKPSTFQSLLAGGIPFEHSVQMKPGAASLRVLVVDENSGRMGSVTIPAAAMGANQ